MAAREDFFTTFSLEFLIELSYEFCGFFKQFDLASFGEGFHPTVQIGNKKWTGVRGILRVDGEDRTGGVHYLGADSLPFLIIFLFLRFGIFNLLPDSLQGFFSPGSELFECVIVGIAGIALAMRECLANKIDTHSV